MMDCNSESNRTSRTSMSETLMSETLMSETLNTWRTELSSSFAKGQVSPQFIPEVLFKDLTFAEAKEQYNIFLQSQLRKFALTQNECSICHVKGKMKASYIDNQGLGHSRSKPQAVCEQCRIKQQSQLIDEFKMKHTNQDHGHQGLGYISPTSPNNVIIVKDPWFG